jgi:hypothetical protein
LAHSEHVCFNNDQIAPERAIDRRVLHDSVSESVESSSDENNQPRGLACDRHALNHPFPRAGQHFAYSCDPVLEAGMD